MHTSELLSTLFLAIGDLEKTRENLLYAADELHRRGKREVKNQERKQKSFAPHEYLEEDALAWSAETLEVMICQLQAVHKRIENDVKL